MSPTLQTLGAAIVLGSFGLVSALAAQEHGPMGRGQGLDFTAIDTNSDGSLDRTELLARANVRVTVLDIDGDGMLDREELIAAMPGPRGGLMMVFAPEPGALHADRLLAMLGATEAGNVAVAALSEHQVNALMARFDGDRDNAISQAEAEARPERRDGRRHGADRPQF